MGRTETALKYFNEQKDVMHVRVKSGIELYRKGDAEITFAAANGELPKDITVEVRQKNHEFKFGCNIFMLDELETKEKNDIYKEKFPECFNLATVPFYWSDLEPEQGKPRYAADSPKIYRRPSPDLCVNYCKEKGIEPKCHCLNYDNFTPDWVVDKTVTEHKAMLEKRFREIAERYAKDIPSFEVTNETLQNTKKSKFFYEDDFVDWSFRMAFHSFFPLEDEEKMDAVRYNSEILYKLMDLYAKLNLPQQITEMTLPAYGDSEENEYVQAELVRNIYSIFFSHPAMEAVIYWNLVDGYAAWAPQGDMTAGENRYFGGLLRFDMSEKPAYKMLKQLINEEWHTEETIKANGNTAKFRGFYGDYELIVHADGKTIPVDFKLSKEANHSITITL